MSVSCTKLVFKHLKHKTPHVKDHKHKSRKKNLSCWVKTTLFNIHLSFFLVRFSCACKESRRSTSTTNSLNIHFKLAMIKLNINNISYTMCSFCNKDIVGFYREDLNYKNCHNRAHLCNNNLRGVIIFVFSLGFSECELIVFTAPTIIRSSHAVRESRRGRQGAQMIILKAHSHI